MFEKLRHPGKGPISLKGVFASILFGLIALTFVFLDHTPHQGNMGSSIAATVNGKVISSFDFQQRMRDMESQMGEDFNKLPAAQRQERLDQMRKQVIEQLVNTEVAYQSAMKSGILPTPGAISDIIFNQKFFQQDGVFQRSRYMMYLENRRMLPSEFEAQLGRDVVVGQVRDLFMTAWQAPKTMRKFEKELENIKMNIEFLTVDKNSLSAKPTDAEVAEFASKEENKAKLQNQYDIRKSADFTSKTEVHARHILIKGDTPESLKIIQELKKEVESGDFAAVASRESQDEGSKARGGDLGFFERGRMVKEFEDVAFNSPIGKVSEPVKTSYGYHIIKVEERRGGEVKPFEEVKNQIASDLLAQEMKTKALEEVAATLKDNKDLNPLIKKYNLKWDETGEFGLNQYFVPKIENGDEAVKVAVKLKPNQVANELLRSGEKAYVIRLKTLKNSGPANLETDDSSIWSISSGGIEALNKWVEENRKSAKVEVNALTSQM